MAGYEYPNLVLLVEAEETLCFEQLPAMQNPEYK